MRQGKAFIFTAPSGSGKTTIVKHLLAKNPLLDFSVSASTRDKRGTDEVHGKDYYFLTKETFREKIEQGAFIEWEEVYKGKYYGTLKEEVQRIWDKSRHVVFDVEVKGALKLKSYFRDDALAIFVKVPNIETLKKRLAQRGTESKESLSQRLGRAEFEMTFETQFDVTLLNAHIEDSFAKAEALIKNFLKK